jgi:hypothetical protein
MAHHVISLGAEFGRYRGMTDQASQPYMGSRLVVLQKAVALYGRQ